jgi:hypothetical protein
MKKLQAKPISGLTGLRKKRARVKRSRPESKLAQATQLHDRAVDLVVHVETLAGLLEVAGEGGASFIVEASLVRQTGGMILEETGRLRDVLETILRTA